MKSLKVLRIERGLRQIDVARALMIPEALVTKWETGRRFPTHSLMTKLAQLYGVSSNQLEKVVVAMKENDNA